jgi:hypothetical protein
VGAASSRYLYGQSRLKTAPTNPNTIEIKSQSFFIDQTGRFFGQRLPLV